MIELTTAEDFRRFTHEVGFPWVTDVRVCAEDDDVTIAVSCAWPHSVERAVAAMLTDVYGDPGLRTLMPVNTGEVRVVAARDLEDRGGPDPTFIIYDERPTTTGNCGGGGGGGGGLVAYTGPQREAIVKRANGSVYAMAWPADQRIEEYLAPGDTVVVVRASARERAA